MDKQVIYRNLLRIQLVEFLNLCFALVFKSRDVLGIVRTMVSWRRRRKRRKRKRRRREG